LAVAVTRGGDPFDSHAGDPFASATGAAHTSPNAGGWPQGFGSRPPTQQPRYNTFAVLAPVFAVLLPPAGVILSHLALPQIQRTHERGRWAAIWALIVGYALCVAMIAGGAIWAASGDRESTPRASHPAGTPDASPPPALPPSVVTSVAPAPTDPRNKLDLTRVTIGTCAEIQLRGASSDDALDLYGVVCQHRDGVYTVVARVNTDSECQSTYVAAPPDHSFALCLNRY
jgi:Domain of unknown function (DUF4190)